MTTAIDELSLDELKRRLRFLEAITPEVSQLLDAVKAEWAPDDKWSERDEELAFRLGQYNLYIQNRATLPSAVIPKALSSRCRLVRGPAAWKALNDEAYRLFQAEAMPRQKLASELRWDALPPSSKDTYRSRIMGQGQFMTLSMIGRENLLVKAPKVTGAQIREIFVIPELHAVVQHGDQNDQMTITDSTVIEAHPLPIRLRQIAP